MKKLIAFFMISVMLFTAIACVCGTQQTESHRGELTVVYDNELTKDLLAYFQSNQDCLVTASQLNEKTDYSAISAKSGIALIKDEAFAEKLKEAGWTETQDWSDAQKKANEAMFKFTVLTSPANGDEAKKSCKLLTDWLVGDGTYEKKITSVSGGCGCGCSRKETNVTFKSDAPELVNSEQFKKLVSE